MLRLELIESKGKNKMVGMSWESLGSRVTYLSNFLWQRSAGDVEFCSVLRSGR